MDLGTSTGTPFSGSGVPDLGIQLREFSLLDWLPAFSYHPYEALPKTTNIIRAPNNLHLPAARRNHVLLYIIDSSDHLFRLPRHLSPNPLSTPQQNEPTLHSLTGNRTDPLRPGSLGRSASRAFTKSSTRSAFFEATSLRQGGSKRGAIIA